MPADRRPAPELRAQVRDAFPDLTDRQAETVAVVIDSLRDHNRHLSLVAG